MIFDWAKKTQRTKRYEILIRYRALVVSVPESALIHHAADLSLGRHDGSSLERRVSEHTRGCRHYLSVRLKRQLGVDDSR